MNILRPLSSRLRGKVFSLLIFFGVLAFSSVFLLLLDINLNMFLGPLFHRILVHLVVSRFGWYSGGFLLAMVFVGLDLENKMMMAPSGSSSSEASVNQPQAPDPAPHEPVAPEPEVYQPLLEDEIRRQELSDRLRINSIGKAVSLEEKEYIVEKQLLLEKKMEEALLSDGYSRDSLLNKRHQIRGFLFYPRGTPLSESTYTKHLDLMTNHGTHRSVPYRRIMEAIYNKDLFL